MTIAPAEPPPSDVSGADSAAGATGRIPDPLKVPLAAAVTAADLAAAVPLLLSVTTSQPEGAAAVLAEAAAGGAHIVRRTLGVGELHFYRLVYTAPGMVTFKTLFVQPSTVAEEALHVSVIVHGEDGTITTSDNTGSSVAHGAGDEGGTGGEGGTGDDEGSSVAHGSFGPMDLPVLDGAPVYYLRVALIDGNTPVDKPYTLVALTI